MISDSCLWGALAVILCLAFLVVACSLSPSNSEELEASAVGVTPSPSLATQIAPTHMPRANTPANTPTTIPTTTPSSLAPTRGQTPTILSEEIVTTPAPASLERLIATAEEDLARRLQIAPDEIQVLRIERAEWSDTSLDCGKPGLARRPAAIPGYRIVLTAGDWEYVYHTGRESGVVYCPKG